ncbi:sialidase-like [Pyrus ussuriensis x Pyrus communis]|uniref:Sialidase-like n=1 Tax=Pyrus ussuriensis x Pyrus communis TaxID=2448454 RepID=A0A5N5I6R7_9ROSA|nr:sialidase-like [Pyrus ussuriensis x Pyrus communis]
MPTASTGSSHSNGATNPARSTNNAIHHEQGQPNLHDVQVAMPHFSAEQHSRVLAAMTNTADQVAMPHFSVEQHSRVLAAMTNTADHVAMPHISAEQHSRAHAIFSDDFAKGLLPVGSRHSQWILESGATYHITSSASCLVNTSASHLPPISLPSGATWYSSFKFLG